MSVAQTLDTVLEKVKGLVQAETVIGQPIQAPDGTTIVPVCQITVGFAAGGGSQSEKEGVGTGAGAVIKPVAFLILRSDRTELIPLEKESFQFSKLLDLVPGLLDKIRPAKCEPKPKG